MNNEENFQIWIELQETSKTNCLIKKVQKVKAQIPRFIDTSSEWLHHHPIHKDGQRKQLWEQGSKNLLAC